MVGIGGRIIMRSDVIRIGGSKGLNWPPEEEPIKESAVRKILDFFAVTLTIVLSVIGILILGFFWFFVFTSPSGILIMFIIIMFFFAIAVIASSE